MTLVQLFGALFLVNLLTVGGGYVMLPLLHQLFVEDFGCLTNREFVDAVAIGQITPGPLTVMNTFIGYKVAGLPGAVTAAAGSYLPSICVVCLVARSYLRLKDSRVVAAVVRGVKPVVVGMLLAVSFRLAESSLVSPAAVAIAAASFAAMAFTKADPALVILAAGLAGAALL